MQLCLILFLSSLDLALRFVDASTPEPPLTGSPSSRHIVCPCKVQRAASLLGLLAQRQTASQLCAPAPPSPRRPSTALIPSWTPRPTTRSASESVDRRPSAPPPPPSVQHRRDPARESSRPQHSPLRPAWRLILHRHPSPRSIRPTSSSSSRAFRPLRKPPAHHDPPSMPPMQPAATQSLRPPPRLIRMPRLLMPSFTNGKISADAIRCSPTTTTCTRPRTDATHEAPTPASSCQSRSSPRRWHAAHLMTAQLVRWTPTLRCNHLR